MKSALMVAAAAACLAVAGVAAVQAGAAPAAAVAASAKVDNFQLTDHKLMAYELYYYKYTPAIVVM